MKKTKVEISLENLPSFDGKIVIERKGSMVTVTNEGMMYEIEYGSAEEALRAIDISIGGMPLSVEGFTVPDEGRTNESARTTQEGSTQKVA